MNLSFLDNQIVQNYIYLLFCCISTGLLYLVTHSLLQFNHKYNTYDFNKKCYILKNIIKSCSLAYLCLFKLSPILYDAYIGHWDNYVLHNFASIYVSNDIMGLLILPKLPTSTKFHHLTTSIMLFYSYTIDFTQENVGQLLFILVLFSSFSFIVNFYLGVRYLRNGNKIFSDWLNLIRLSAHYIYIVCCIVNWTIQTYILGHRFINSGLDWTYYIYISLLIPVITDDLVLIRWLREPPLPKIKHI